MTQRESKSFPLERTAVVSGCGAPRGIGRVVARRLVSDGWSVAVCDIRDEVLEFAEELRAESAGVSVLGGVVDITEESSVASFFGKIDAEMPPIVGQANPAGIACPTRFLELSKQEFERVVSVNATGTLLMMQAAAQRMATGGVGRIVNFSSITAFDGGGTFSKAAYAAAKAAVIGLSRGGARELGPMGITVNVICPGPINTEIMGGRLTEDRKDAMSADIPVGRVGEPTDIAALVGFLLSQDAGFVNGATISADGGKHMK